MRVLINLFCLVFVASVFIPLASAQEATPALDVLEHRRLDLEKATVDDLIEGRITVGDAREMNKELGDICVLQSQLKNQPVADRNLIQKLSNTVESATQHLNSLKKEKPRAWAGINRRDVALGQEISAALDKKQISKDLAESLKFEADEMKTREASACDNDGLMLEDAISIAADKQALQQKIKDKITAK